MFFDSSKIAFLFGVSFYFYVSFCTGVDLSQATPKVAVATNVFSDYFAPVDTISLEIDSLYIGQIFKLIALDNGNIVFYDAVARSLIYLETSKHKAKPITLTKYIPGLEIHFRGMFRSENGDFWIVNDPNRFIRFSEQLEFLDTFVLPSQYHVGMLNQKDVKLNILMCDFRDTGTLINRFDLSSGKVTKFCEPKFQSDLSQAMSRIEGGGMLVDLNGNVYLANSVENKIYKYDSNGNFMDVFSCRFSRFQQMQKDIPPGNDAFLNFLQSGLNKSRDNVYNIFFLSDNIILVNIGLKTSRGDGLQLFSTTGTALTKGEIMLPAKCGLYYASNNFIYLLTSHSELPEGELQNPKILRYKLIKSLD